MSEKDPPKFFDLCSKESTGIYLRDLSIAYRNDIDQESDDYINNVEEEKYAEYLINKYSIAIPFLDFEQSEVSTGKRMVRAEDFPPYQFSVRSGEKYERPTVIIHIPYEGEVELLRYHTGIYDPHRTQEVFIEDGNLCFEVIDFHNDLEIVNRNRQVIADNIRILSSEVIRELVAYNRRLESEIPRIIEERKAKIENITKILGIPIKKRQNLPASYEIPTPQSKKSISLKPQVTEEEGSVEFTLEDNIYFDILQVIHDYGNTFEQYPSISEGKDEEEIRDHFLFVLQPRYNWMAAGEAFNKLGKTDILIRYEKAIVFIAELKFWKGEKTYLATISQLFDRYLIWRNSKAAVVIFVKNKNFSAVIDEVKNVTPKHPNFVRFVDEKDSTWLNYVFHINDNPDREVKLAVLLFHIPPKGN